MKNTFLILFILFTIPIYSQWVYQNSGASEYINDVFCITEDIVVAVGDNGTILKTTNGGLDWVQKTSGTIYNFQKVRFANQNIGYAISSDSGLFFGELHKTTDGGESWSVISTNNLPGLSDISVVNENVMYYTNNSILNKTTDGGVTFQAINTSDYVQNIQFINEQLGFGQLGEILAKTTDGGNTWEIIHQNTVFSFYFLDDNIGFVNATDGLSKTIDGGVNFNYLTSISSLQYKLFATTEKVIWGAPVRCLLNGDPCYSTRVEINETGGIQREDYYPQFQSYHFFNQTIGYGCADGSIFKNSTGTLSTTNQVDKKDIIQIFPNPASNQVTISFTENSSLSFSLEIIDNLGKKIFSKKNILENQTTINIASFAKGLYFIKVQNQEKKQIKKLIIN